MGALDRAIADPEQVGSYSSRSPVEGLARRTIEFPGVLAQSVSAVAPSASAITIPLFVGVMASGSPLWAFGLAIVIALLIASSINQFTRRFASTGSLYTFVSRGLGAGAGLASGIGLTAGYAFIAMFAISGTCYYLQIIVTQFSLHVPLWTTGIAAVCSGALMLWLVTVIGIRISTRIVLLIEAISVAIILIVIVVILVAVGPARSVDALSPAGTDWRSLSVGGALALTAFVGFESSSTLGAEAKRPLVSIPRSIIGTVVVSGVLYLLATVAQLAGFSSLGISFISRDSPVNDLSQAFGVGWLGALLDVGVAGSFFAASIAAVTALVRLLFSMGREGVLPSALGVTHKRLKTPHVASAVVVPIVALVPLVWIVLGGELWPLMELLLVIASLGFLTAYLLVCVATPVFLFRIGELTVVPAVTSILASATLIALLPIYVMVEINSSRGVGVVVYFLMLLAGLGYYVFRLRKRPIVIQSIGLYDEPTSSDVLGGLSEIGDNGEMGQDVSRPNLPR